MPSVAMFVHIEIFKFALLPTHKKKLSRYSQCTMAWNGMV